MEVERQVPELPPAAALPRSNGELVFDEPWQGRAFGMVVALHRAGRFQWNDFRDRLVREITASDAGPAARPYYESWLTAFERLLVDNRLVDRTELRERQDELETGRRQDVF